MHTSIITPRAAARAAHSQLLYMCGHSPQVDAVLAAPLGDHVAALTGRLCSGLQALTARLGAVGVLAQACCQLRRGRAHSLCMRGGQGGGEV